MRLAFSQAAESSTGDGAILVIEGLDQLAPQCRTGPSDEASEGYRARLTTTLLTCLDGVDNLGSRFEMTNSPGLGVIATSCIRAEDLDSRLTRPGRMDHWIGIKPPAPECR